MKIGFVGGGNMAQAIAGGWLAARGRSRSGRSSLSNPPAPSGPRVICRFAAFDVSMLDCEVLVLAVKPQSMSEALAPLRAV